MGYTYREPDDTERERVAEAYNDYYSFGSEYALEERPVVIIEDYETGDGSYRGRLAVVVDGGASSTTFGFDGDEAFLVSDALNEKRGADPFGGSS